MDDDTAHREMVAGLAFSGRITASVTHELNNVLGTIEQVVGLLEDFSVTDPVRQAGMSDKLMDVVGRVAKQTDRGTALIKRLNKFAHLSDNESADCNLGELVEHMAALCARFATMARVELITKLPEEKIVIKSSPFQVASAIFSGIEKALQIAKPKEPIQVTLGPCEGGGILTLDVNSDEERETAPGDSIGNAVSQTPPGLSVKPVGDGLCRIEVRLLESG